MKSFIVGSLWEKKIITCRNRLGSVWVHILQRYSIVYVRMLLLHLYNNMKNFCNFIGLEQWYLSLIWNTYKWKLQTFCG